MAKLLALLILWAACATAQRVEGSVFDAATGAGVGGVKVELLRGAGDADLATQDVEISSDVAITVVYKTDGGSVRGTAENCVSGGVLLVPIDPVRHRPEFSKSGPCDSRGRYEIGSVRPGDYNVLAFAGNGLERRPRLTCGRLQDRCIEWSANSPLPSRAGRTR